MFDSYFRLFGEETAEPDDRAGGLTRYDDPVDDLPAQADLDHCPTCGGRVGDYDPDGYELPDGQRGHRSCGAGAR